MLCYSESLDMPKLPVDKSKCSVAGCTNPHISLHRSPALEPIQSAWLNFIFGGNVPASVGKILFVCAKHFKDECFSNLRQYQQGFAERLRLIEGSVPSLYGDDGRSKERPTPTVQKPSFTNTGCQTKPQMRSVGTQLSMKTLGPHVKSIGTQVTPKCFDEGPRTSTTPVVQTETLLSSTQVKRPLLSGIEEEMAPVKRPRVEQYKVGDDTLEGSSTMNTQSPHDPSCDPDDSMSTLSEIPEDRTDPTTPAYRTSTYIVYENCLLDLFGTCPVCQRATRVRTRTIGTLIHVEQRCEHCEFVRKWNSQPLHGGTPAGNLQMSAAIYSSGGSFTKVAKIFRAMRLRMFQHNTYRRHARLFIEPAIIHMWKSTQKSKLEKIKAQSDSVILGGDLRDDSSGHSAKFGSYSMMDLRTNNIIDLQLVQSNEVGGTKHMELEGLKRSIALLTDHSLSLDCIVTDRHPQVQKYLREQTDITHYYDVWHVEKGLSKKLVKIAKNKDCTKLSKWLHSLKNHIYWTAVSSRTPQERLAKWTSILNHVQDVHTHDDPAFPQCLHPPRTSKDESKWLKPGTPAFCRLKNLLTSKQILKDVEKLSPHLQTSAVEAFYSVILRFVPKTSHCSFLVMLCRLYLAALHFNENAERLQAITSSGQPTFRLSFPKFKKGEGTAVPIRTPETFNYVDDIMELVFEQVFHDPTTYLEEVEKIHIPPTFLSQHPQPVKAAVDSANVSHFIPGPV